MKPQVAGAGTQVSEEGLDQMRGVHQRHLDNLSAAVSLAGEMARALQAGNPFGLGEDGSAAYRSASALTNALHTAVQDERDNLEKLWANFRTWGELVTNTDLGAAQSIASAAPHGER
ncbi:hypothetical protein [Segniliparus rugosus]|uniref:Uncharacterized protein n=1 Tax=Segniliparus rugosus (strain ATCC BAA-974 / DSM 45345 / CCUG 50838 / CIP 108380 / JCM 13579 / CDC 945) TaxID=679197 RepID=E5XRF2_SEGRC|nr:hypothetical protein [Segniliparus rugosus]EFV13085.1 hypothetical protein HMPREF9336_02074 [Segniliparus rugosus ATCC BAA-974]